MPLSIYHQKQAKLSDKETTKRTLEKENELKIIFENVNFGSKNIPVRIAVL